MSYDGIVLKSVKEELIDKLQGGRVDRVYQPGNNELQLNIRSIGKNYKLLISAAANNPRVYLTELVRENPKVAPNFCMLMRKYLEGSRVLDVFQYKMDRIIKMDFLGKNEMGDDVTYSLIIEIMGKHSNIILINTDFKIVDAIKRVPSSMSSVREILPGGVYSPKPISNKADPLKAEKETFISLIKDSEQRLTIKKFLVQSYTGISPLISREIAFDSNLEDNRPISSLDDEELSALSDSFFSIIDKVKTNYFTPNIVLKEDNTPMAFSVIELKQYGNLEKKIFESVSELLDAYYRESEVQDKLLQKSQHLRKVVSNHLERSHGKQQVLLEELQDAIDREKYKVYADLISANIYSIERGAKNVKLQNFYSEELETIDVPLDIKLNPVQNAQKYYKKYSKLKNAANIVKKQLTLNKEEIRYLETVQYNLENAEALEDIEEIKSELVEGRYIKSSSSDKKSKRPKPSSYLKYENEEGFKIYVGKNNKQNEQLTLKDAAKEDLWFHVKDFPGSHVIVKQSHTPYTENVINQAATLAAINSTQSLSENVEVDYTLRKYIKRHPSKKPGLVNYVNFKTVNIRPDKELLKELTSKK